MHSHVDGAILERPAAEVMIIEGAGHAAHLEQPRAFEEAVLGFLRRLDPPASAPATLRHTGRE